MGFLIRNISGSIVEINDLGIFLDVNDEYNLVEDAPSDVALSSDLVDSIQSADIVVLDPLDDVTPLTITRSLEVISTTNNPNYRIHGGTISQLEDVSNVTSPDGYVLSYNEISQLWEPSPPGSSSGDNTSVREAVNQINHGFVTGTPIYFDGTIYQKAKADNINTLGTGVADVATIDAFDFVTDGDIIGLSGLTSGSWYYVSDSVAGELTAIEPTNTYSNPIAFAESATKMHVQSIRASDLTNGEDTVPRKIIHQMAHGFSNGTPIYFDGVDYQMAQANSVNTLATEVALPIDTNTFESIVIGMVIGLSGLIPGSWYFVSATVAGGLITTEPSIFSNPIGVAETSSTLFVIPTRAVDYTNT